MEHAMYAMPQAQSTKLHDVALMPRTKGPSTLTPLREDRERHNGTEANSGLSHCNGTGNAMKAVGRHARLEHSGGSTPDLGSPPLHDTASAPHMPPSCSRMMWAFKVGKSRLPV